MTTSRGRLALAVTALVILAFSCSGDGTSEFSPAAEAVSVPEPLPPEPLPPEPPPPVSDPSPPVPEPPPEPSPPEPSPPPEPEPSAEPSPIEPQPPSVPEPEPEPVERPVRFGLLIGLSGDFAAWGPSSQDGAEAAIGEINASGGVLGREVELVVEDNLSSAAGSVAGYERIREEIDALGGIESVGALALLDTLATDEMPTMCPVCGTPALDTTAGNFLWRITASDTTYGVMLAHLARNLGYTRIAVLAQQTSIFESEADSFRDVWETKVGGEITADVRFEPEIGIQMAQVVQAFEGEPEAVYVGAPTEAGMLILREYIDRGYDATILITPELIAPEIANAAARLPTGRILGVWITDAHDSPAYSTFAAAHREYAGKPPPTGLLEANQYDQYIALALAMAAAGSTDGRAVAEQVPRVLNAPGTKVYSYADGVAALERGEDIDYDGASGSLQINETGNVISLPVAMYHIVNGEFTSREIFELDPALSP